MVQLGSVSRVVMRAADVEDEEVRGHDGQSKYGLHFAGSTTLCWVMDDSDPHNGVENT